jgi:hypothetical protein
MVEPLFSFDFRHKSIGLLTSLPRRNLKIN